MAEMFPGPNPEAGVANTSDKPAKKDRRRRAGMSLGSSVVETPGITAESVHQEPKASLRLDRGLLKKLVKAKLEGDNPQLQAPEAAPADVDREAADASDPAEQRESEAYRPPEFELKPGMLFEGEGIIDLGTDEQVILLHSNQTPKASAEEVERSEAVEDESLQATVAPHIPMGRYTYSPEEVAAMSAQLEVSNGGVPDAAAPAPAERPQRPVLGEDEGAPGSAMQRPPETGVFVGAPETLSLTERYHQAASYEAQTGAGAPAEISRLPGKSTKEHIAAKAEFDDAIYRATKAGQNRGVLTGLIVGAGYEHHKHKKLEKKSDKQHQAKVKQFEKERQETRIRSEEQDRRRRELEGRVQVTESKLADVENGFQKKIEPVHAEKPPIIVPEQPQVEQLNVPPEHRVQTSAWHSIEIDAKTGKPVENPTFAYGEEYNKERAQESKHKLATQGGSSAGPSAANGSSEPQTTSLPGTSSSLPPVGPPSATTQGPPSDKKRAIKTDPKQKTADRQATGPIWPWLVALLAIVISLALILH